MLMRWRRCRFLTLDPCRLTLLFHWQRFHALQLCFGIDEEVSGGRDLVACLESGGHLHHFFCPHTDAYLSRLEVAVSFVDINDLSEARVKNGVLGDGQFSSKADLKFHVGEHLGFQLHTRVGNDEPGLGCPCLAGQSRIDVVDLRRKLATGKIAQLDSCGVSHLEQRQFVFVYVCSYPDAGEIGNIEQFLPCHHLHALDRGFLEHVPAYRTVYGQGTDRFFALFDLLDLLITDVPEL